MLVDVFVCTLYAWVVLLRYNWNSYCSFHTVHRSVSTLVGTVCYGRTSTLVWTKANSFFLRAACYLMVQVSPDLLNYLPTRLQQQLRFFPVFHSFA